ncbi:MAG: exonuclease SbcCD subunit D C-terminal domain-containing protein [Bacteroidia bacterium]
MKILHTADWHLGKRLEQYERTTEHQLFLDWLLNFIQAHSIDVLLVAGDIFDSGNPSNEALKLYYDFLINIKKTNFKCLIIIGGNHDSVSTLNAPKTLLQYLNIHVMGGVPENHLEQIIPIFNQYNEVELVICAVPFLRDRDIRLSVAGESTEEREARIKQGISHHYQELIPSILPYKEQGIPVIATGHLYAAGAEPSDSEKEIHVGSLGQIAASQFPTEFDYIALGHLHKPQLVNKLEHIRYSGSPIALSFSENEDIKQVLLIATEKGKELQIDKHEIPVFRKLLRLKGNLDELKVQVLAIQEVNSMLPAWIELQLLTDKFEVNVQDEFQSIIKTKPFIEEFFLRQIRNTPIKSLSVQVDQAFELADLNPRSVFIKKFESLNVDEDTAKELLETFDLAMSKMEGGINS